MDANVCMTESMSAEHGSVLPCCNLILVGPRGQVGSAFRRVLRRQRQAIATHAGVELRLIAAFDRHGMVEVAAGIDTMDIASLMGPRCRGDTDKVFERLAAMDEAPCLAIDCTASEEIADAYEAWLSMGIGIVTANKRANARDLAYYCKLQDLARARRVPYRYETTVGAAIPLLGPLRDMRMRGERVTAIRGVLSGSLSYLFNRLHDGVPFSKAVGEARALGYTEPDPMEDLRAIDLSRKLLVLAREAGFMIEASDLQVDTLCGIEGTIDGDLVDALRPEDELWARRVTDACSRGERLVVMAEVNESGARVALRNIEASSPFAAIRPGQNLILIETDIQGVIPIVVSGPGAGVDVTAAGVLSDVVTAALHRIVRFAH
jgi:homoserine dehydrogenase